MQKRVEQGVSQLPTTPGMQEMPKMLARMLARFGSCQHFAGLPTLPRDGSCSAAVSRRRCVGCAVAEGTDWGFLPHTGILGPSPDIVVARRAEAGESGHAVNQTSAVDSARWRLPAGAPDPSGSSDRPRGFRGSTPSASGAAPVLMDQRPGFSKSEAAVSRLPPLIVMGPSDPPCPSLLGDPGGS